MVLESQPDIEVVGEAGDGARLLAIVRRTDTDVVLMDIQMPRVNGLIAAVRVAEDAAIREHQGVPPRIVLVTATELEDHLAEAAAAEVFAVLYKDVQPELLLETVRAASASASRILGPPQR